MSTATDRIGELEWLALHGKSFGDDQQGMLYTQLSDIMRGNLDMIINDDHVQALRAQHSTLHNFLGGF